MTPEQWDRLRAVLEPALEQPPDGLAAWLDRECPAELRADVDALIAAARHEHALLDHPVWTPEVVLTPGTTIDHYVVREPLGSGGMGIVYRARDSRLARDVAIKVMPGGIRDASLLDEARLASSLNHPNIVVVHDVVDHYGAPCMVMELVDGRTVAELVEDGALQADQAIRYAAQMASALATAHEAGVLHRDFKPSNVIVRTDGVVKVLDFGIARSSSNAASAAPAGTAGYMAPEQASGDTVDERADVYGFGAVLRDMLAGRGASTAQVPARWRPFVEQCLADAPTDRPASMREIEARLRRARSSSAARWWVAGTAAATLSLLALVASTLPSTVLPAYEARRLATVESVPLFPRLAPDGRQVAYAVRDDASSRLVLHQVDQTAPADLGVEGRHPAWSPDGRWLAFRSERDGGGLFVLEVETGVFRQLTSEGFHPDWSPDGAQVVYATSAFDRVEERTTTKSELRIVDVATGRIEILIDRRQIVDAIQPRWSRDGRRIAFWSVDDGGRRAVWTVSATGGPPVAVTDGTALDWSPAWSPDGWLYWSSNRGGAMNLWRARIDMGSGELRQAPEAVTLPASYVGLASFADDGTLAYSSQQPTLSVWRTDLQAPSLSSSRITPTALRVLNPSVSPDGDWLVAYAQDRTERLVIFRADGTGFRYLTDAGHRDRDPAWSPDGDFIAFGSNRGGDYQVWKIRSDGTGLEPMVTHPTGVFSPVWSTRADRLALFTRGFLPLVSSPVNDGAFPMAPPQNGGFRPVDWSWDETWVLGSIRDDDGARLGLALYAVATGEYHDVSRDCDWARFMPGQSSLICARGHQLWRLDPDGTRTDIAVLPRVVDLQFELSPDGRWIYQEVAGNVADVWVARRQ